MPNILSAGTDPNVSQQAAFDWARATLKNELDDKDVDKESYIKI